MRANRREDCAAHRWNISPIIAEVIARRDSLQSFTDLEVTVKLSREHFGPLAGRQHLRERIGAKYTTRIVWEWKKTEDRIALRSRRKSEDLLCRVAILIPAAKRVARDCGRAGAKRASLLNRGDGKTLSLRGIGHYALSREEKEHSIRGERAT